MKLKIALPLTLAALSLASSANAYETHKLELDATVGYRFGGTLKVDFDGDPDLETSIADGQITTEGAPAFGGILGYRIQQNGFIYLGYSRQQTEARFRPFDGSAMRYTNASIEYFQFGGNLEVQRGRATPYFGFSAGVGRFASLDEGHSNIRFSAVFDGGVKIRIVDFLHLRLLGRLPLTFTSGKLYCYSGAGCAIVVNNSPFVQGEVQAGLGLRF